MKTAPPATRRTVMRRAIATTVRALRSSAGITQEILAYDAGVDRGYVGALERARHSPTLETIYKLLPVLKVTFEEFAREFDRQLKRQEKGKSRHGG